MPSFLSILKLWIGIIESLIIRMWLKRLILRENNSVPWCTLPFFQPLSPFFPFFDMHYCAPLANKLGVETRISTTLVESVGARVIAFGNRDLHPRTEAVSQDDACTNVIALEAYAEVTLNGYSSHECIGNTGIRIRVFSGWMHSIVCSIGRYSREKGEI